MKTTRGMGRLWPLLFSVVTASCYGPSVASVREAPEAPMSRRQAMEILKNIEGCTYGRFMVSDIYDEGIKFEFDKQSPAVKSVRFPSGSKEPPLAIAHSVKSGKDVVVMGAEILLASLATAGSGGGSGGTSSGNGNIDSLLLPWDQIKEVKVVYPVSNILFPISLALFAWPNFYYLDFYSTRGKLLFSAFPKGQMEKTFILTSSMNRNSEYCRRIAGAVFTMRDGPRK